MVRIIASIMGIHRNYRAALYCTLGATLLWFEQSNAGSFMMPHPASHFTTSSKIEPEIPHQLQQPHSLLAASPTASTDDTTTREVDETTNNLREEDDQDQTNSPSTKGLDLPNSEGKKVITATSCVTLPFSCEIAFDAFSDLSRQPSWSNYLTSVEYVDCNNSKNQELQETKWTMSMMKMTYSWNSIHTKISRPNIIEWRSTSGMQNGGRVTFDPADDNDPNKCKMTMTMSLVAPKALSLLVRRTSRLERLVQEKILDSTLTGFRDTVVEIDLKGSPSKARS
jgi:uncharacterized membrane protein